MDDGCDVGWKVGLLGNLGGHAAAGFCLKVGYFFSG